MPTKSSTARWNETIHYLNTAFPNAIPKLGDHINTIVTGGLRDQISAQLSLGSMSGVHKANNANKNARKALRGLLLCQRVYFSDLWASTTFVGGDTYRDSSLLDLNWKQLSLKTWGMQSEASIRSAIAMFTVVPGATAADVALAARTDRPSGMAPKIAGNLTVSRNNFPLTGPSETCYRGVLAWLLKAGVISFRWFMKNSAPSGSQALNDLFGPGVVVWAPNVNFTNNSVIPHVEAGFVVHMWMEDSGEGGWNGHWVISNGDGTICGVNNGIVNKNDETVIQAYTKNGKLRSQFEGYGGYLKKEVVVGDGTSGKLKIEYKQPLQYAKATMVKFDPLNLPGRM